MGRPGDRARLRRPEPCRRQGCAHWASLPAQLRQPAGQLLRQPRPARPQVARQQHRPGGGAMRTLKNLMLAVAITTMTVLQAAPATAAAGGGPPPGCRVVRTPTGWEVICGNGGGGPGGGGGSGGGGGGTDICKLFPLPPGYPDPYPAPKGEKWMWIVCQVTEQTGHENQPGLLGDLPDDPHPF